MVRWGRSFVLCVSAFLVGTLLLPNEIGYGSVQGASLPELLQGNWSSLSHLLHTHFQKNRPLIVTDGNYGFRGILLNLLCQFERYGESNVLVIAADEQIATFLRSRGIRYYYDSQRFSGSPSVTNYGQSNYKLLVRQRWLVLMRILYEGFDVLHMDPDMAVHRHFSSDFPHKSDCDWEIQSDNRHKLDPTPDETTPTAFPLCAGFWLFKANPRSIQFARSWVDRILTNNDMNQPILERLMNERKDLWVHHRNWMTESMDDESDTRCRICILHPIKYPTGHYHWLHPRKLESAQEQTGIEPAVYHFNYIPNTESKLNEFRKRNEWHLTADGESCLPEFVDVPAPGLHGFVFGYENVYSNNPSS